MSLPLCFEDISVQDSWRSHSRTITETDIVNFACLTGDFDPLHVDHEFAKNSPYHQPLAHGLLGLSWVAGLGSTNPRVHTLAFITITEWSFLKPAFVGDTVHVVNEVVGKEAGGRRSGQIVWRRELINQNDDVVQSGAFRTLVACRIAVRKHTERQTVHRKAG